MIRLPEASLLVPELLHGASGTYPLGDNHAILIVTTAAAASQGLVHDLNVANQPRPCPTILFVLNGPPRDQVQKDPRITSVA